MKCTYEKNIIEESELDQIIEADIVDGPIEIVTRGKIVEVHIERKIRKTHQLSCFCFVFIGLLASRNSAETLLGY